MILNGPGYEIKVLYSGTNQTVHKSCRSVLTLCWVVIMGHLGCDAMDAVYIDKCINKVIK
jgi:hypothetical protein